MLNVVAPSILASKGRSATSSQTRVGSGLTSKYYTGLKMLAKDKHSMGLYYKTSYGSNSFCVKVFVTVSYVFLQSNI
jgi:hypothetical protein